MEKNESGDEVSEMVNQAEGIGFVNQRLTVTSLKLTDVPKLKLPITMDNIKVTSTPLQ